MIVSWQPGALGTFDQAATFSSSNATQAKCNTHAERTDTHGINSAPARYPAGGR